MPHTLPDPDLQPEFYEWVPFKRGVAFVIDTAAIFLLSLLAAVLTVGIGFFIFPVVFLGIGLAYRTVTIARWSATPGMKLMAIEFRTLSGYRLDQGLAFMHSLLFTGMMIFFLIQIASVALMLMNPRGQGLSDMILGTTALNCASEF